MANQATLELISREGPDGTTLLLAPDVGTFSGALESGHVLVPGATGGWLTSLGRRTRLLVPAGVHGAIQSERPDRVHAPVGHGDLLYSLAPVGELAARASAGEGPDDQAGAALVFRSTTAGRFWHSATPGDPPLCAAGAEISEGDPIGLIEVMKTFAQVPYRAGSNLPARARVVRVLASDGADVDERAALIEVEPA